MTIAEPSVREDELRFARLIFNRLAQRSGNDQLLDEHTVMGAQHVAAMGHLGNYHYFLLRDQPEQALLSAYRCTEQFPALGVWLFPVELFSQDYRGEVPLPHGAGGPLAGYRHQRALYQDTRRRYRLDLAWRVPAAAGYIIAGLAAATVSPPMAARGVQGAMGLLATTNEGILPPSPSGQAGVPETRGRGGETAPAGARRSPGAARGRATPPLLARRSRTSPEDPLSNEGAFR